MCISTSFINSVDTNFLRGQSRGPVWMFNIYNVNRNICRWLFVRRSR